jgi:alkylation response protein AidB-like acyl-CoA dehydrogenase
MQALHARPVQQAARGAIAAAKFLAPNMAQRVVDAAMQAHGAAGVSQVGRAAQLR